MQKLSDIIERKVSSAFLPRIVIALNAINDVCAYHFLLLSVAPY